ncbi:MAG TPA: ASCH domain-containing protein, partial [Anaerolineae bacterium]|nr:ASCH domain-containing protein [Anaerolineae bacterium]
MTEASMEAYWEKFLAAHPSYRGSPYVVEPFGDNPALADELGNLVLSGRKSATCSSVWEYEAKG